MQSLQNHHTLDRSFRWNIDNAFFVGFFVVVAVVLCFLCGVSVCVCLCFCVCARETEWGRGCFIFVSFFFYIETSDAISK